MDDYVTIHVAKETRVRLKEYCQLQGLKVQSAATQIIDRHLDQFQSKKQENGGAEKTA